MINKEQAINIALKDINEEVKDTEYILNTDAEIIEQEKFWYIPFIEKNKKEIKDWVGAYKGYIVDKKTSALFMPGSAYSLETWMWGYNLGFTDEHIDFTIKKVSDMPRAIELVNSLGPQYLIGKSNNEFEIEDIKYYTKKEISTKLKTLPYTFKSQNFTIKLWAIKEIMEFNVFEFEVVPSKYKYGKYFGELVSK